MKTTEQFIQDAIKVHGDKFEYSLTDYKGAKIPIKIQCKNNHIFEQRPNDHLNGFGCKICYGWGELKNIDNFISRANKIHNNCYDYSKSIYIKHDEQLIIICPEHGEFNQSPACHITQKHKCPKCSSISRGINNSWGLDKCIENAKLAHCNYYDYSECIEYKNTNTVLNIICPKHGRFKQNVRCHVILKQGCPVCNFSKGELAILKWLKENNINYNHQYKFKDCKNKRELPFDFYLPNHNLCIEYQGEQHFKSYEKFGGTKSLLYIQQNDQIKRQYCQENNIKLLEIYFKDIKKINTILNKEIINV